MGSEQVVGVRLSETYDGLWGELMFVMHDPEHLWRVNEGRADWFQLLALGDGLRILDLGCGNGFLDVVLGRRGHTVVGVDRVSSVIDSARRLVADEAVKFVASDLRDVAFDDDSFDAVLMFGLVGLMSKENDSALLRNARRWLTSGGSLLADCDRELSKAHTSHTEHGAGVVHWKWSSDPATRTNLLTPELHRIDGVIVELKDPIDPARGEHTGLHRYIYPQDELAGLLRAVGFDVTQVDHYLEYVFPESESDSYMLLAQPRSTRERR